MIDANADVKFIPQLTVGLGYSDNIQLQEKENEISESIFEVNPGFFLQGEGRTYSLKAKYRMQNIFYSRNPERDVRYNQLQADLTNSVLDEVFFVDASILHTQGVIEPDKFYHRNSGASTGYFRDETYLGISPYIRHTFASLIRAELRYRYDRALYEKSSLDNVNQTVSMRIDSMQNKSAFTWEANYLKSEIVYDSDIVSDDINLEKANLTLQYRFSRSFALYSDVGYENNNYRFSNTKEKPVGNLWLAGFIWSPNKRTFLKAGSGERFYGDYYSLDFKHRSRRLDYLVKYSEDIVNVSQVQSTLQAFDDAGGVATFPFNTTALDADAYIRRIISLDIGYDVSGSRVGVDGYWEKMENQNSDKSEAPNRYRGIGIYWEKRLTHYTNFRLSTEIRTRSDALRTEESQINLSSFSIEHVLAKNAKLAFNYSYSDSSGAIDFQNYTENYVSGSIALEW